MKNFLVVLVLGLIFSIEPSMSYVKVPHIDLAPGHLCTPKDKDFVRYRYAENIPYCKRNVTPKRKDKICALYGVTSRKERRTKYTVDHIIPLSMGGSNHDKNLWCQHRGIYTGHLEYWLYEKLRDGEIRQAEAMLYILSHKHNPKGKDHIPYPPEEEEEQR
jgi:hypothetical protein